MCERRRLHSRPLSNAFAKPAATGFALAILIASGAPNALGQDRMSARAAEQIQALMAEKAGRTAAERRIDSQLLMEMKRRRGDAIARRVPMLQAGIETARDGSTVVDIQARVTPQLVARIEALGGTVVGRHARYRSVRARVPLARLDELASSTDIDFIMPATEPITNMLNTSEGDARHRADTARSTFGVDGSGVNLCALSDSVDNLAPVQASGDLPFVTVLPGQSGVPGSGEGTAMLEIIHDLAPGAGLFFATAFNGEAGFANNIVALRSAGCDVIVDDVFYVTEPVFQDGIIARAVQTVTADGALYFSSAGNSGNLNDGTSGVWEGDFVPAATSPAPLAGSEVHDFGGVNMNTLTRDSPLWFALHWADPQGGSGNDYDLYLLDPSGTIVESASTNIQNGNDNPFEFISSRGSNDSGSHLVIVRNAGAAPRFLHLNTHRGRLAVATDGQVTGHSAVVDAFAVAAVNVAAASGTAFDGTEPVERFSSDGPRQVFFEPDGSAVTPGNFSSTGGTIRLKPDVAAADGVVTATPGFSRFFGTSAAAPHAAAIAGLLLEADPSTTTASLRSLLASTALDIEAPGFDRDSGAGIFDAFNALAALGGASADVSVAISDTVDPVGAGSNVTYSISVANAGPDTAANVVTTQSLPAGIPFISASTSQGSCSEAGGVVTCDTGGVASGGAVSITTTVGPTVVGTLTTDISVISDTLDPEAGNNAASESTTVNAGGLVLTIDEVDGGSYGNKFGTPVSDGVLSASFIGDGTTTYYLQVTGFDIDFDDEVSVHVNGTLAGNLTEGPNNDFNGGDVFELTPAVTTAGTNTIEFRQRVVRWKWGVTELAVLSTDPSGGEPPPPPPPPAPDIVLAIDSIDPGSYGHKFGTNSNRDSVVASFPGDGVTTVYLQVTGFDIDFDDEISVHLNGVPIGHLTEGPNNLLNAGDVFVLPTTMNGTNLIEFRERESGWKWGVTAVGVLSAPP